MPRILHLEVENFKSYGGRHTIGPFRTFTSVIGPNGSGKSNLMDAISFVLGVRTQQLRGAQLADLIHRKASRKASDPLPGAAYVELVYLPEEDKPEIKFRRTISRNAQDSKYSVNGRTISLKDYKQRLADIGVRISAQNFLVFQNDVIAVAQKTSQQLAQQIDLVSGSADLADEYNKLKQTAEEAREAYAQIYERKRHIKKQQHDIRIQKDEAEHFESLTEQLQQRKVQYFLWTLFHLESDLKRSQAAVDQLSGEIASAREKLKESEDLAAEKSRENAQMRKDITKAERGLKQQVNKIEASRPTHIELEQQIALLEKNIRAEEVRRSKLQKDYRAHQAAIKQLTNQLRDLRKDAEREAESPEIKELELAANQMREYQELRRRADEQSAGPLQTLEGLRKRQATTQQNLQRAGESLRLLTVRERELQDQTQARRERQAQARVQLDQVQEQRARLREQLGELQETVSNAQSNRGEIEAKLAELDRRLRDANSDRRQTERERKFQEALERLRQHFPGVHGRLADMCKPIQQKYNLAVAVALARDLDSIVVDEERVAVQCIQYLRKQRLCVATFLPLDTLVVQEPRESYRRVDPRFGDFKLVFDVVKCSPAVRKAVMYACGDTLVTDSLKSAQRLCYDPSSRGEDGLGKYKVVCTDGSLIHKSGNMTGGEGNFAQSARAWDDREIGKLVKQQEELRQQLEQIGSLRRSEELRFGLEQDLLKLENEATGFEAQIRAIQQSVDADERQVQQVRKDMERHQKAVDAAEEEVRQLAGQLERAKAEVDRVRREVFADFAARVGVDNIEDYEETRMQSAKEALERRMKSQQEINRLVNQLAYEEQRDLQSTLDQVSEQLEADRDRLAALVRQLKDSSKRLEAEQAKEEDLRAQIKTLSSQQAQARAEYQQLMKKETARRRELEKMDSQHTVNRGRVEQVIDQQVQILRRCQLEQVELPKRSRGSSRRPEAIVGRKRKQPPGRSKPGSKQAAGKRRRRGAKREDEEASSDEEEPQEDTSDAEMQVSSGEEDEGLDLGEGGDEDAAARALARNIDFDELEEHREIKNSQEYSRIEAEFINELQALAAEIQGLNPNLRATDQFAKIQSRLRDENQTSEELKRRRDEAQQAFQLTQERRHKLFMKAFNHIKRQIGDIYRDLTKSAIYPTGGKAYILLDSAGDKEDLATFEQGVQYNVMPSGKRYKDMDQLSGGEQTIAALALLFAIHSFSPAPFFVLDEVDAALDNTNVLKVAQFIRQRSRRNQLQCIVISLKDNFYTQSDALVGVFRDRQKESSGVLTLDLRPT